MVNRLRKMFKSEKGFTLVELLAVIVILGIIAAIAVPAVGNVIEDSKKKAHIANAQSFLEAARLYDVSEDLENDNSSVTLSTLQEKGYIKENLDTPSGNGYSSQTSIDHKGNTVTLYASNGGVILSGDISTLEPSDVELSPSADDEHAD